MMRISLGMMRLKALAHWWALLLARHKSGNTFDQLRDADGSPCLDEESFIARPPAARWNVRGK